MVDVSDMEVRTRARWLVEHRREMEQGESGWLRALARFDDDQGWAVDGQTSLVAWLGWQAGMEPAGALSFTRPDGSHLGTTHPAQTRLSMAA